jgi:hypothetical protein
MNVLMRFLKVMLLTGVLALLGPVLIYVLIMLLSPGSRLRSDINYEEHVRPLAGALGMWFGMMFFVGFISFVAGLPRRFTVATGDREGFVERMNAAARSVRYRPQIREGNSLIYKPPFYSFLAEKITVELGEGAATLSAPLGLRKKLEKKLAAGA